MKNMRIVYNSYSHQLANIGATSHVKNNLNIIGVGYTAQKKKKVWFDIYSFLSEVTLLLGVHRSYSGDLNLLTVDLSLPETLLIHINIR